MSFKPLAWLQSLKNRFNPPAAEQPKVEAPKVEAPKAETTAPAAEATKPAAPEAPKP